MQQALQCARRSTIFTAPNPNVGCVIAQDDVAIAEGSTSEAGGPHAEINALRAAEVAGRDVRGATLYVTLEPCSHHGRTPPCADAIVAAGIRRVVVACIDPNPLVAGRGIDRLRAAGIEVRVDVLADEARELNLGFFRRMERGRPWVRMKLATTLDGKTALPDGDSKWITSQAAREDGHRWRARAGAILTGIGTVAQDDPEMTVRFADVPRQPLRIIVDSRLAIADDARILSRPGALIVTTVADPERQRRFVEAGIEVATIAGNDGKVDLPALMRELGRREINELHVEAGPTLSAALVREHCVDELLHYIAPRLMGEGSAMLAMHAPAMLDGMPVLRFHDVARVGDDLRILARFQ
ncbi:MAG: bifunctional diaminohydroxyphosphoribosylaminopyrimidine deaminase/5-amino-6-(5-phosphoribosylamino)uracil reductase RibD [Burkholderiaceae bacterium]